jgi:hypothetical protein
MRRATEATKRRPMPTPNPAAALVGREDFDADDEADVIGVGVWAPDVKVIAVAVDGVVCVEGVCYTKRQSQRRST